MVPSALYVHCSAHSLNLAVAKSCELPILSHCLENIRQIYVFFNTPKRQNILQNNIDELQPGSKKTKLKNLCPTRWIDRYESVDSFLHLQSSIRSALAEISTCKDRDTAVQANNLLAAISKFEFLIALEIFKHVFPFSVGLCKYLQKSSIDLSEAVNHAGILKNQLESERHNIDDVFSAIFRGASENAASFDVDVKMLRIVGRQTTRPNIKTDSVEQYYKITAFIPYRDSFINYLQSRFVKHNNILN